MTVRRWLTATAMALSLTGAGPASAASNVASWLLFDAQTGEILAREKPFQAWQPASVTKLMTTYVVLKALRAGRIRPTSPVIMSARASQEPPSKMGFPVGSDLSIENALKIIMVKSANDVAWALGEAVSGSREAFIAEMNAAAIGLGMASTHFVNSNGLPADGQMTNAHDLALLARALLVEFPERTDLYNIGALQFGKMRIPNHNDLLERFPGSDGMKTGFICASGFNVVASATRGGRRLIAVVLGAHSSRIRAEKAAELFTKGFDGNDMLGFMAKRETIYAMEVGPEITQSVGDLKPVVCGKGKVNGESTGEDAQGADAAEMKDIRATWLSPRQPPGPAVKIWLGGTEMPHGAGTAVAAAAAATPSTAPIRANAGGIGPAKAADAIKSSFDLVGQGAAPIALSSAGAAATPTGALALTPIIEELPEPPKPAKKVKAKAKAQPKAAPKPAPKTAEAPKKKAHP